MAVSTSLKSGSPPPCSRRAARWHPRTPVPRGRRDERARLCDGPHDAREVVRAEGRHALVHVPEEGVPERDVGRGLRVPGTAHASLPTCARAQAAGWGAERGVCARACVRLRPPSPPPHLRRREGARSQQRGDVLCYLSVQELARDRHWRWACGRRPPRSPEFYRWGCGGVEEASQPSPMCQGLARSFTCSAWMLAGDVPVCLEERSFQLPG